MGGPSPCWISSHSSLVAMATVSEGDDAAEHDSHAPRDNVGGRGREKKEKKMRRKRKTRRGDPYHLGEAVKLANNISGAYGNLQ